MGGVALWMRCVGKVLGSNFMGFFLPLDRAGSG